MISAFKLTWSILLPLGGGYALYRCFVRKSEFHPFAVMGLSYGLGLGVLTQWMFFLSILNIRLSIYSIILPLAGLMAAAVYLSFPQIKEMGATINDFFRNFSPSIKAGCLYQNPLSILMTCYISVILFSVFWQAFNIPAKYWDELSFIAFKAKVFFYTRSIILPADAPWSSYPLHVPLAQAWVALMIGEWDDQFIKIIFPFALLAYVGIQYAFLSFATSRKWALFGTCLLLSSNILTFHAAIGYTDIFLMYYNCTAIILMLIWVRQKDDGILLLASLFAGFATFIKLEGTAYLFLHIGVIFLLLSKNKDLLLKSKFLKFIKFLLPSTGICLSYHIYKLTSGIPASQGRFGVHFSWGQIARLSIAGSEVLKNLFWSGNWNIIWPLMVLSLIVGIHNMKRYIEIRIILYILIAFFGLFLLFCTLCSEEIWSDFSFYNTLSRIILHFFPLATIIIIFSNFYKNKEFL